MTDTPPPDRSQQPPESDAQARRQREAPRRGAPPGRQQTGWPVTRRWFFITLAVFVIVNITLLVVLLRGS